MRLHVGYVGIIFASHVACAVGVAEDGQQTTPNGTDSAAPFEHDAASGNPVTFDASGPTTDDASQPPPDAGSSSSCGTTGTLVSYDFSGQPGNQTATAATSKIAGITAGSMARSTSVTATSGTNSINGSNWSTSGIDTSRYYTFTITPSSCSLDITSISIDTKASTTGPSAAAIATSEDAFATKTSFTPGNATTVSLSVTGATKPVEVRVYGFTASGTAGTWRVQNTLTATGSLN